MLHQYCFNGVHITLKGRIFDVNFYYVDNFLFAYLCTYFNDILHFCLLVLINSTY